MRQRGPGCGWQKSPPPRLSRIRVERAGQSVHDFEAHTATGVETLCQQPAGEDIDQHGDEPRQTRPPGG